MKNIIKLFTSLLVLLILLMPLMAVQAKGLEDGPIFGSSYTLKSGQTLNQDLVVIGGSVSIEKNASVNGSTVLIGGSLTLDGEVTKDVVVLGGAVKLGPETHIHGNLVTVGGPVDRDQGAIVDGDVVNNLNAATRPMVPVAPSAPVPQIFPNPANAVLNAFGILGQSIILALFAMLIAMFLPTHLHRVADTVSGQPLIAFGLGLISLILFIVALVALVIFSLFIITLILTIPLIFVVSVVFSAAMVLGWLALGMEVGIRSEQMFKREWPLPLIAGLGVFFLNLVAQGINFIPCIGWMFSAILSLAGLGAVVMTRFGTKTPSLTTGPAEPGTLPKMS